jgi:hypothetical protein
LSLDLTLPFEKKTRCNKSITRARRSGKNLEDEEQDEEDDPGTVP